MALHDRAAMVRWQAVAAVARRRPPFDCATLLGAFDMAADPVVRSGLVLAAARAPGTALEPFRAAAAREADPDVAFALWVARAALGEEEAARAVVSAIDHARGYDRAELLERAARLAGEWLLPSLESLLADRTPLVPITSDVDPAGPLFLRTADRAAEVVAQLLGHPLRRRTLPGDPYDDDELDAAAAAVRARRRS